VKNSTLSGLRFDTIFLPSASIQYLRLKLFTPHLVPYTLYPLPLTPGTKLIPNCLRLKAFFLPQTHTDSHRRKKLKLKAKSWRLKAATCLSSEYSFRFCPCQSLCVCGEKAVSSERWAVRRCCVQFSAHCSPYIFIWKKAQRTTKTKNKPMSNLT